MSRPPAAVRQLVTAVYPVRLPAAPPWEEGPLPFEYGGLRSTRVTRSGYFTAGAAHVLYGVAGQPRRWHRPLGIGHGPLTAVGVELLHTPTGGDPLRALAVVHLRVTGAHLHGTLRALAGRSGAGPVPLAGPLALEALLQGHAERAPGRPYTTAFLTTASRRLPPCYPRRYREHWPAEHQWLWALASRSDVTDYPPDPARPPTGQAVPRRISADWSVLVLRDGAAFLGHRPDRGERDPFFGYAELNSRTVYTDALLLGIIQRGHIDQLSEDLASVFEEPAALADRLADLESDIARFRSSYWRQHLAAHGPANDLLRAYQGQHRLPERFAEILAEVTDYARLAQSQENQRISGALGVLTILGLPLGTALSVQQILGDTSAWHLLAFAGGALAATAALLTTPYGRLVLRSLRGARRGGTRDGGRRGLPGA